MNKIFILKGKNDTGKTTKINQIAEWIINNYGASNSIGLDPLKLHKDTNGILAINKLTVGFNSAGDSEWEVKKVEKLKNADDKYPDIIICACRTKGAGFRYLENYFNYSKGWLKVYINVEEYSAVDVVNQTSRDNRISDEIKTWLTGLEKL